VNIVKRHHRARRAENKADHREAGADPPSNSCLLDPKTRPPTRVRRQSD
jgi:hypothetical protein